MFTYVHKTPWNFARYSSFGLNDLLERDCFEVSAQRKTSAELRVLFQLTNTNLQTICGQEKKVGND